MTIITTFSKKYKVRVTDHTNTLAERLGYNIAGEEFIADEFSVGNTIRGYLMVGLFGMVRIKSQPITLYKNDLEEVK